MVIEWDKVTQKDLCTKELYNKILKIQDYYERKENEFKLYETAKKFKCVTIIRKEYNQYKKNIENETSMKNSIDFGETAPIRKMSAIGYYLDKNNCIRTLKENTLITATPIEPTKILKNQETGEESIECVFNKKRKWVEFIVSREILMNNKKITNLAKKGVDVTSTSAGLLVAYLRDLLISNELEEVKSTSRMGWHNNDFLPYDGKIKYDGSEEFNLSFKALSSKGKFEDWADEIGKLRKDNVVLKMVMATSFASPLLKLLNRSSFVTHLWGKTGGKKTVAGKIAMSIWGDSGEGKLMFKLDSTENFFCRVAAFFNNIPCFFDELQTFDGNINKLIMCLTEGIDRGKAKIEGGIQDLQTWKNTFIFTGEDSISSYNSGGGTLNRTIEIYIKKDIVEDGMAVCDFLENNYGTAGKVFIDYIKQLNIEDLKKIFKEKFDGIVKYNITEEKQAINMAMILLADELACRYIFKGEKPLSVEDVIQYMFTKDQIDNTQRAYNTFLDVCVINRSKFAENRDDVYGEYWGVVNDYEISIVSKKLQDIMRENGFNYNKVLRDWEQKGLIEKNASGKYSTHTSKGGLNANFITIKLKSQDEKFDIEKFKRIFSGVVLNIQE